MLLGNDTSYVEALIQASGVMLRMSADAFSRDLPGRSVTTAAPLAICAGLSKSDHAIRGLQRQPCPGTASGPLAAHDARPCRWRRVRHDAGISVDDAVRAPPGGEHHGTTVPAERTDQLWKRTPSGHRPTRFGGVCLRMLRRGPGPVSTTAFPTACVMLSAPIDLASCSSLGWRPTTESVSRSMALVRATCLAAPAA